MAYLLDHPPASPQFRRPRREKPSGVVVVHSAENVPDINPPDTGAEQVAGFIARRSDPGSYHDLVDSDSIVQLVPYDAEAFHDATGSNRHAYSVSGAFRVSTWGDMPQSWRNAVVRNMAIAARGYAAWLEGNYGIVIPARRISREESEARIPGFISHAERDPANRTDPGPEFPWDQFLAEFAGEQQEEEALDANQAAQLSAVYESINTLNLVAFSVLGDATNPSMRALLALLLSRTGQVTAEEIAAAIPDGIAQDVAAAIAARLAE